MSKRQRQRPNYRPARPVENWSRVCKRYAALAEHAREVATARELVGTAETGATRTLSRLLNPSDDHAGANGHVADCDRLSGSQGVWRVETNRDAGRAFVQAPWRAWEQVAQFGQN